MEIFCSCCGIKFTHGAVGSQKNICPSCTRTKNRAKYRKANPVKPHIISDSIICSSCGKTFLVGAIGSYKKTCPDCTRLKNRERYKKSVLKIKSSTQRTCSSCGKVFINGENGSSRGRCPACISLYHKNYNKKNAEIIAIKKKNYNLINKEKVKTQKHDSYLRRCDYVKENVMKYYFANKEKIKEYRKKYYSTSKSERLNTYLANNMRSRVRVALKLQNGKKANKTMKLIGCSIEELKEYIEKQFQPGMSWDNWGNGVNKWNIDHIKSCASFDLTKQENQYECFNYKNLQPLWYIDNIKKSDKMPDGSLGRFLR